MKGVEYRGLESVEGSVLVVKKRENSFFGEVVHVKDRLGTVRVGRIIEISTDACVVQVFANTSGFSVEDSKTGTLTAQIKGGRELNTSPSMVENGKTIVFTATPNKDYIVESWFNGTNNVTAQTTNEGKKYELTIDKALEVKVKFKKNEVTLPPSPDKVKVKFSVDGGNGQLKAKVEGNSTEYTDGTTGINVEKGKKVIFTATPDKDYVVESWFNGTTNVTAQATNEGKKYELTVNKAVEIKVKFKKNEVTPPPNPQTVRLKFSVEGEGGWLYCVVVVNQFRRF